MTINDSQFERAYAGCLMFLQTQLDDGFSAVNDSVTALRQSVDAQQQTLADQHLATERQLEELRARLAEMDEARAAHDGRTALAMGDYTKLQAEVKTLELKHKEMMKQVHKLDAEQGQLHPFFRFMQQPHLQQQLQRLTQSRAGLSPTASASAAGATGDVARDRDGPKHCLAFYSTLKIYLVSYLLNTKLLSEKALLDRSADTLKMVHGGLTAVLEVVGEVLPLGKSATALAKLALYGVELAAGQHASQVRDRTEAKLVESGAELVTAFSVSEAEYLAQLLSLMVTKCYELQLHKLTEDACKELAKAAVTRIAMSLSTALDEIKQQQERVDPGAASSSTRTRTSTATSLSNSSSSIISGGGGASVNPTSGATPLPSQASSQPAPSSSELHGVRSAVDRLCDLFLRALRVPFVERQAVKFWSKATFSTVNPVEHKDWNADGIFSKSGVVVAVKPAAAAAAGGVSTAVAPARDCSVLAASVLSDVLQTGDEAQVG
jgi:hypothetical protein